MNRIFSIIIIITVSTLTMLFPGVQLSSQENEGKLVFTIRKPKKTVEAFKKSLGSEEVALPWWQLYTSDICTLNPDGTSLTQLTDDGTSRYPKWSPDGRMIAYISGIGTALSLNVMNEDSSDKGELLTRQYKIHDFWWSADSTAILVAVETEKSVDPMENWQVTVDGKSKKRFAYSKWAMGWNHWDAKKTKVLNPHPKLISALPNVNWPIWSPDNKYIAFTADNLAIADVDGVIASGKWFPYRNEPPGIPIEWSKDGKKILFFASGDICAVEIEKGKLKNMVNLSTWERRDGISYSTWNRDASKVAFVAKPPGRQNREIYIMGADGNGQTQITNTNYDHIEIDWK